MLKHMSLCTGYGGIDLGLHKVLGEELQTICYSEIDAFAVSNLLSKMEQGLLDSAPIWTDLKTLPWQFFVDKVDILSGGFPCQPFSMAGVRSADEDPRHLWPHIKKGIERLNYPAVVFLENVEGLISAKLKGNKWSDPQNTSALLHILRELERLDYSVEFGVFSAKATGAPQLRKRVFILGVHSSASKSVTSKITDTITSYINETNVTELAYPAPIGEPPYIWEPPRTFFQNKPMIYKRLSPKDSNSDWDKFEATCIDVYSRSSEMKLLGNGVVPQVAQQAFIDLWVDLQTGE